MFVWPLVLEILQEMFPDTVKHCEAYDLQTVLYEKTQIMQAYAVTDWSCVVSLIAIYPIKNNSCALLDQQYAGAELLQTAQSRTMYACFLLDWSDTLYIGRLAQDIRSDRKFTNTVWSDELYIYKLPPLVLTPFENKYTCTILRRQFTPVVPHTPNRNLLCRMCSVQYSSRNLVT